MEDVWNYSREGAWDSYFSKRLNDWEVNDMERFFQSLQGRRVCRDVED